MTQNDLGPGYVVKCRDGVYRMVALLDRGYILIAQNGTYFCLSTYTSDLVNPIPGWTVDAVYGYPKVAYAALVVTPDDRDLLWERKEPKKMTVKEICDALGYEVEIVKEASDA